MHLKIYFGDKPLFLCDAPDPEIEPFRHHDDAVLIDELSAPAINAMLHEMHQPKVHAGIFMHSDLKRLKESFFRKFVVQQAGGGLVTNESGEALFIFRRGFWDLPKGKREEGEAIETCALREVEEETALRHVTISHFLVTTYHTYVEQKKQMLKESHWYRMEAKGKQRLKPQTEEDITDIRWVAPPDLDTVLHNTFPSIIDVVVASKIGGE